MLDAAKNAADGDRRDRSSRRFPLLGVISLFTLKAKKPAPTPTKEKGLPLSTGEFVSTDSTAATPSSTPQTVPGIAADSSTALSAASAEATTKESTPESALSAGSSSLSAGVSHAGGATREVGGIGSSFAAAGQSSATSSRSSAPSWETPVEEVARRKAVRMRGKRLAAAAGVLGAAILLAVGVSFVYGGYQHTQEMRSGLAGLIQNIDEPDEVVLALDERIQYIEESTLEQIAAGDADADEGSGSGGDDGSAVGAAGNGADDGGADRDAAAGSNAGVLGVDEGSGASAADGSAAGNSAADGSAAGNAADTATASDSTVGENAASAGSAATNTNGNAATTRDTANNAAIGSARSASATANNTPTTEQLNEASKQLKEIKASIETLQSSIKDTSDIETSNRALIAINARLNMIDAGGAILSTTTNLLQLYEKAQEGWNTLLEGDSLTRDAATLIAETSPENTLASSEISTEAITTFAQARESLVAAQDLCPEIDLSAFLEYIDLRIEAQEQALASNQAYLERNKERAGEANEAYNNLESEAATLIKSQKSDPIALVEEYFEQAINSDVATYDTERARASEADAFLRDYLGIR